MVNLRLLMVSGVSSHAGDAGFCYRAWERDKWVRTLTGEIPPCLPPASEGD